MTTQREITEREYAEFHDENGEHLTKQPATSKYTAAMWPHELRRHKESDGLYELGMRLLGGQEGQA